MTDEDIVKELQNKLEEFNSLVIKAHSMDIVVDLSKDFINPYTNTYTNKHTPTLWKLIAKKEKFLTPNPPFITYTGI